MASQEGRVVITKQLIDAGADLNIVNNHGATALYVASQEGHALITKQLIDAGADFNKTASQGRTPLLAASCISKSHLVVELLIINHAHIDERSKKCIHDYMPDLDKLVEEAGKLHIIHDEI